MKVLAVENRFARRLVNLLPRARALGDQVRDQQAGDDPVRDALTRIPSRHVHILATGIAADEAAIVDGLEDLSGPAVRLPAQIRDQASDPRFQAFEADPAVIAFTGLMIRPANDQVVGCSRTELKAHVMVGIERVPIERNRAGSRAVW